MRYEPLVLDYYGQQFPSLALLIAAKSLNLGPKDITASVEVTAGGLSIRTSDLGTFTRLLPSLAREVSVSILEVHPADESLESVFSYLVQG